jgi:hypothetical protein
MRVKEIKNFKDFAQQNISYSRRARKTDMKNRSTILGGFSYWWFRSKIFYFHSLWRAKKYFRLGIAASPTLRTVADMAVPHNDALFQTSSPG